MMGSRYGAAIFPQHAQLLADSGISPEVAAARGYVSVDTKKRLESAGYRDYQRRVPGLLIPVHDTTGAVATWQYRPDNPRVTKAGKTIKYETPGGSRLVLDIPPRVRDQLGDPAVPLWITEGARKADAAVSAGLCCIGLSGVDGWQGTNPGGGKTALGDWRDIARNGRRIYLAFDSDAASNPKVAGALERLGRYLGRGGASHADVRYCYLPAGKDGAKTGLDDYLAAGGSVEALIEGSTPELVMPVQAELPGGDDAPSTPSAVPAHLHTPPSENIDGNALLVELRAALTRYVVLPSPESTDAVILWVAATHAQAAWEHATRLVITAPEKRCGKSRLLDVIEATCHKPLVTVNISPAALVRSITEDDPPTLLLDEADTVFGRKAADNHEDLRGLINSGHQRNRPYIRWDAASRTREDCPTFSMAALAGIGDLPDTIMDRAVIIRMRRRAPGEEVEPYRTRRDRPPLETIRSRLASWAEAHRAELRQAAPELPVEDRAADNWEPLVAVADFAGGDWPARARKAALLLFAEDADADTDASLGLRLLADVRDIFAGLTGSFLPSADLTARLRCADDGPWLALDLSMHKLAFLLRPYSVRPRQNDERTARGYHAADFADAFMRYLTVQTVQPSAQDADQQEYPDTSLDTSPRGNCASSGPDTSAKPDCPDNCPPVSAGQQGYADGWTVADTPLPESWPEGSFGEDAQ